MIKKIIISSLNNIAAIINQNKIQELIVIKNTYQVNDIYIGIVQKIFTSINAAFIQLNYNDKSGFIHINDIKPYSYTHNANTISDVLNIQQKLLVQIIKEPTHNKGPRLTTNIHLSGKYLVLMPFNNTICLANKIYDENERSFLKALGTLIKPANMGLLFKESATGMNEKMLIEDLQNLKQQWNFIQKAAINKPCPSLLYKDDEIVQKVIRDYWDNYIHTIIIDSKNGLKQVQKYLHTNQNFDQHKEISLQLYKHEMCILEKFSINSAIFQALQKRVEITPGIYIFIESLEALTIIDVNSGSFNQSNNAHNALLRTNCLAASEIAYQLKIRNINGIVLIDFIDMKTYKDKLKLLEHLNQALKTDNAKPEIIQLSKLGLVELTRRRQGQSLLEIFANQNDNIESINICSTPQKNIVLNVNTIFFKKKFTKIINLGFKNRNKKKKYLYRLLIPYCYRYIIPISLYYSSMEHTINF